MLILEKIDRLCTFIVEMDEYVPLDLAFDIYEPNPLYWRGGDGKTSLIEIGLSRNSGLLKSITLTNLRKECSQKTLEPLPSLPEKEGNAVFFVDNWTGTYDDSFDTDFTLATGLSYVSISFDKLAPSIEYVVNNQIRLGINQQRELASIVLTNLTESQTELFHN